MTLHINTSPNNHQLSEINSWLKNEFKKNGEGFLNNWNIIESYFENGELIILIKDSKVIGFTTWKIYDDLILIIDIVEIHPDYRKSGYGKFMMQETFKFCISKGAKVVNLFCSPESSYSFWKSFGFLDMPKTAFCEPEFSLYKPLIEVQIPIEKNQLENEIIELWDCEPYQSKDVSSKWIWAVKITSKKISPPILIACSRDWNIRLSKNGEVIRETKVKYFSHKNPIDRGKFMFIDKLEYL